MGWLSATTSRQTAKVGALAVGLALAIALMFGILALFSGKSSATHVNPTLITGNKTCSQLASGTTELQVEPVADGTFTDGTLTVTIDVRNTNAGQVFDWTSNIGVDAVFVKGGNDGNLYSYSPEAKEDTGLHAPVNPQNRRFFGLSHISFCYDPNAVPTLTTEATTPVTLGDPISDTATLSGGNNPTGTITFTLYGPDDADCSGEPAFISENRPIVNGSATSAEFEPLAPGTYRWTAQYNGDDNNDPVLSPCNADNETSVVNKAPSAIATVQSFIPQDQATVTGFGTPGGTVTFELFKSLDCSGTAVYTEEVDLSDGTASTSNNGNPNATPAGYSINAGNLGTGEFSWKVTYSGDANNKGSTSCNEESTITEINNDNTPV